AQIATRNKAVADMKVVAEKAILERDREVQAAREAVDAAAAENAAKVKQLEEEHMERAKRQEVEWVAKLASMADSLNRTVVEKDSLRDLQRSEIERQVQMRQNAWSDRMTQLRQELDSQRNASEAERTTLMQEHHKKLMELTEDCKAQVMQARRQMADAELAAVEKTARTEHDLKEALHARDEAESQLKHQADSLSLKLAQAQEDTGRQVEKVGRQE